MPWRAGGLVGVGACCLADVWDFAPALQAAANALVAACQRRGKASSEGEMEPWQSGLRVRRLGCENYEIRPASSEVRSLSACSGSVVRQVGASRVTASGSPPLRWHLNASVVQRFLRRAAGLRGGAGELPSGRQATTHLAGRHNAACVMGQLRALPHTACALRALVLEPLDADVFLRLEASAPRAVVSTAARLLAHRVVRATALKPSSQRSLAFPGAACYIGKRRMARSNVTAAKARRCRGPSQELPGVMAMWGHWRACMQLVREEEETRRMAKSSCELTRNSSLPCRCLLQRGFCGPTCGQATVSPLFWCHWAKATAARMIASRW
eukprot:TRINITY_DN49426_c0_g1_i1.p1 TRINITY_DN49426_c0_g1~~TRINITY_DN49426_c0_g1_i1.p1  ORF type:complete len:326 (-),score=39.87 TRINITY_DN49426_c0_g1_i1:260-1237(-)